MVGEVGVGPTISNVRFRGSWASNLPPCFPGLSLCLGAFGPEKDDKEPLYSLSLSLSPTKSIKTMYTANK